MNIDVKKAAEITGYSIGQIKRSCKRLNLDIIGGAYIINKKDELPSIIEEIKNRKVGNPNFIKNNA